LADTESRLSQAAQEASGRLSILEGALQERLSGLEGTVQSVASVGSKVDEIQKDLSTALRNAESINELQQATLALMQGVQSLSTNLQDMANRPKPKGFKRRVENGKKSIVIVMDNGEEQEFSEQ